MIETYDEIANALTRSNQRNNTRAKQEDLRAAVVALRSSQFLFQSSAAGHYAILKSMQTALEPHFELSGSRLLIDEAEGYAALVPIEDVSRLALSVEETLLLLTLRWIFETKVEMHDVETDGSVRADEAELQQWYEHHSDRKWPRPSVVKAAIDLFERRSVIQSSVDDMGGRVVFIRGVVRLVTGSGYLGRLRDFLEARSVGTAAETDSVAGADAEIMSILAPVADVTHDVDGNGDEM